MWRPLLLHLLDLATVVATTSQCLEWWGELRRYLLQSSLREQSVTDVSDDPLSSSTFFDSLLRTGARELKGMKWWRIRRRGVAMKFLLWCLVRSLSAKYRPDRYRRDKSVKFGTELP